MRFIFRLLFFGIGMPVFFVIVPFQAKAQMAEKKEKMRQMLIERLLENQEGGADYTDLLDAAGRFFDDPLNINTAGAEDLRMLGVLNEIQIQKILRHRQTYGDFIDIRELQQIQELDRETISFLLWMTTARPSGLKSYFTFSKEQSRHTLISLSQMDWPLAAGIRNQNNADTTVNRFLGNPLKQSLRYRYEAGKHVALNLTAEKDEGEPFGGTNNPAGFDFMSGSLQLKNVGVIQQWVIGDFNCTWGQGLTLGTGLAFGKSALVMNVKRNMQGIRAYRSVNENEFLRGTGIQLGWKNWEFSILASHKKEDANVVFDSMQTDEGVTGLVSTGFHRTKSEFLDKQTLGRTLGALRLNRIFKRGQIGFNGVYQQFSSPLVKGDKPYQKFQFSGKQQAKIGVDYSFWWKESHFFGEMSVHDSGGWAMVHGYIQSLGRKADFIVFYRRYQPDFKPLLTAGFGESYSNANEEGLYTGWVLKPASSVNCSLMVDFFRFPWLRYQVSVPGTYGYETLGELQWVPNKQSLFYIRARQDSRTTDPTNQITQRKSVRVHAQVKTQDRITLKSRVEWSSYQDDQRKEYGLLAFQDFQYEGRRWEWTSRIAYFKTDGFYSRIYAYENDVLYSFSVPAFMGRGIHSYLLIRWKPAKKWSLAFRHSFNYQPGLEERGSGLDQTLGPWRQQSKIQFICNF